MGGAFETDTQRARVRPSSLLLAALAHHLLLDAARLLLLLLHTRAHPQAVPRRLALPLRPLPHRHLRPSPLRHLRPPASGRAAAAQGGIAAPRSCAGGRGVATRGAAVVVASVRLPAQLLSLVLLRGLRRLALAARLAARLQPRVDVPPLVHAVRPLASELRKVVRRGLLPAWGRHRAQRAQRSCHHVAPLAMRPRLLRSRGCGLANRRALALPSHTLRLRPAARRPVARARLQSCLSRLVGRHGVCTHLGAMWRGVGRVPVPLVVGLAEGVRLGGAGRRRAAAVPTAAAAAAALTLADTKHVVTPADRVVARVQQRVGRVAGHVDDDHLDLQVAQAREHVREVAVVGEEDDARLLRTAGASDGEVHDVDDDLLVDRLLLVARRALHQREAR
eukprot:scaffold56413_cov62-Phaeocystis_antarctica.AAC.2